jgi:exopolyphosphatase/guanosine-5'-triphosphate,3'-diphosphate pyrophosphatase
MAQPRVIAVIDVGSNSVRLLVGRELIPTAFEVVDEERFYARLGDGTGGDTLSADALERGALALRLTAQVAASYGPAITVAVGTEALRRAPNAAELIARSFAETGIPIQVLTAAEEAYASFLGVINSTALVDGTILDIGGGSVEVIDVAHRQFRGARSAPLGALYARTRFLHSDPPTKKELRALRRAVRAELALQNNGSMLVGVGGAIRNLARIARLRSRYPLRRLHGLSLERAEVRRMAAALARVSAAERRRIPGVSSARADILHGAAVVVDEAMRLTGASHLLVSGQGLREGLLWQEIRRESPILPDVRAASISGLARANSVDELAAEPTVSAAALLFEATAKVHGLGAGDLDLLVNAARLAGIGMHIDYYNRDRHAEYVVHSGDLHGFSHREIVLLGSLVRCAEGGSPDLAAYRSLLEPEDVRRVSVVATLLGIARAIRRRRPSPVLGVDAAVVDGSLRLVLHGTGPLDAEVVAVERQQRRLQSILGLDLAVEAR